MQWVSVFCVTGGLWQRQKGLSRVWPLSPPPPPFLHTTQMVQEPLSRSSYLWKLLKSARRQYLLPLPLIPLEGRQTRVETHGDGNECVWAWLPQRELEYVSLCVYTCENEDCAQCWDVCECVCSRSMTSRVWQVLMALEHIHLNTLLLIVCAFLSILSQALLSLPASWFPAQLFSSTANANGARQTEDDVGWGMASMESWVQAFSKHATPAFSKWRRSCQHLPQNQRELAGVGELDKLSTLKSK